MNDITNFTIVKINNVTVPKQNIKVISSIGQSLTISINMSYALTTTDVIDATFYNSWVYYSVNNEVLTYLQPTNPPAPPKIVLSMFASNSQVTSIVN